MPFSDIRGSVLVKTDDISLLALQELTSAPRVISAERNVTAFEEVAVFIRLGRLNTSPFSAGVNFRIEASPKTSGNFWNTITTLTSNVGSSIADEAVSGTCPAGQNVIGMASTTGFAVGDVVYIDNPTTVDSEFVRVKVVTTNVSITLEDNLENAQTGSTVYDQAEIYSPVAVDVRAYSRIRVVIDGSGAGQNFAVEVKMVGMR